MLTFTYPAEWRAVCQDARSLVRQREALKEAWRRTWGPPIGSWHVEFQPRHGRPERQQKAPHLHMYLGLPDVIAADEFEALQRRTTRRHNLERRHGKYEGRARLEPPAGDFAEWLLVTWWRIVGSGEAAHRRRGADITPAFWSNDVAATVDRTAIADYFWRESGKFGQKQPPEDFGGLRFWGVWGERHGFVEVEGRSEITRDNFFRERRVYRRLVGEQMKVEAAKLGVECRGFTGPRGRDGLTAFVADAPHVAARVARTTDSAGYEGPKGRR